MFCLILGMLLFRDLLKRTLDINQRNCVNAILQRYGFVDSRSVRTPATGKPLTLKLGTLLDDSNKQLYQAICGSLIYLSTYERCLLRNAANPGDE